MNAEVLLRGERAAVALGRGPVGDVVEERLGRGADDGDDVRARVSRGLRLQRVVVDVAGGDDDVLERRRPRGHGAPERLARGRCLVDALEPRARGLGQCCPCHVRRQVGAEVDVGPVGEALGSLLQRTHATREHRARGSS